MREILAVIDRPGMVSFTGGLFFWLRLRNRIDTCTLLPQAIAAGEAFMPSEAFFHAPELQNCY